jgi:iron complex outermembrane receptor protein
VEGTWRFNNEWSIDLAYTWINPEYDDAEFDAAQRYYYYDCPVDVIPDEDPDNPGQPFLCGNTNIDGNQLNRTSKEMGLAAISYVDEWFGGWTLSARVDASYQSKQYINPLNVGYIGSRTLYNGSVNFTGPESHWDVTLWGKNLADDNYVQSTFSTALFTNSLVATGQGRSVGGTLKYNF